MARQERDREDLIAEATALVERVEFTLAPDEPPIVAGIRRGGALSLYFGPDPAFHFNTRGELRRAFHRGLLLKAEGGRLASLRRERTTDEVQLQHHVLSDAEQQAILDELAARLDQLRRALETGTLQPLRQVPADLDVRTRLAEWLAAVAPLVIASSPNV